MFSYPYSYGRPTSYYSMPSTTGYPYNYPRGFGYDDDYARQLELLRRRQLLEEEMERRQQLAAKQRLEQEALLEEQRRNEAYRRMFGNDRPRFEGEDEPQGHKIPIRSRSNSPAPKSSEPRTETKPESDATMTAADDEPAVQPESSTPAEPAHSAEEMARAASKIQKVYRRHRVFAEIESKREQFLKLKQEFKMPAQLDFEYSGKVSVPIQSSSDAMDETLEAVEPVSEPPVIQVKMAYTPNNAPLHYYAEQLNRLLIALDGIESFGNSDVRKRRKEVVGEISSEVERIEGLWRNGWDRFSAKTVRLAV